MKKMKEMKVEFNSAVMKREARIKIRIVRKMQRIRATVTPKK